MKKVIEKNVAVIIIIVLFSVVLLSSCASTGTSCSGSRYTNYNMCPAYH